MARGWMPENTGESGMTNSETTTPAVVGDVYDRLLTFLGDRDNAIQGDPPCATELDASVHEILEIVRPTPSTASPDREEIVGVGRALVNALLDMKDAFVRDGVYDGSKGKAIKSTIAAITQWRSLLAKLEGKS